MIEMYSIPVEWGIVPVSSWTYPMSYCMEKGKDIWRQVLKMFIQIANTKGHF